MFSRGGRLVLSPTDVTTFLGCAHATALDLEVARGERPPPSAGVDEQLALVAGRGLTHEADYRDRLVAAGREVVEIPGRRSLAAAEAETVAALRAGVDVVAQGALYDGRWLGYADFLVRIDGVPSDLGDHAYEVVDTKLARHLSAAALVQLATYGDRLQQLQGVAPPRLVVVTGDGRERAWRPEDARAYAARARARLQAFVATSIQRTELIAPGEAAPGWVAPTLFDLGGIGEPGAVDDAAGGTARPGPGAGPDGRRPAVTGAALTAPVPVPACARCRWREECAQRWAAEDDLSLVAGMRARARDRLRSAGVTTLATLAGTIPASVPGVGAATLERLQRQARLQARERADGVPLFELLPHVPGRGLHRLPAPDPGDLYLDFEGDPFAAGGDGREYLAGVLDRQGGFRALWAHDATAEAVMVADLLRLLVDRWREHPGMHVYHYAPYEQSALKRLTGRYGVGEAELDALLRGGRFVDLYAVVRQGLLIGKSSYSIKKLEDLYWGRVRTAEGSAVSDGMSSVVEYERWLAGGDDEILTRIADYNREDVRSTLALHDWLEERRTDLAATVATGGGELDRPAETPFAEAGETELAQAERLLAEELAANGHELWAGLVGWHRREDRPGWWDFFRRAEMADVELLEDGAAIANPWPPSPAGERLGRGGGVTSRYWRYAFPPQPCRIETGVVLHDVDTRQACGTVVEGDVDEGWVTLSRGAKLEPAHPRGFMPPGPLDNRVLRESIARQAAAVLAGHAAAGQHLVERRVPADLSLRPGEPVADAVVRIGCALDGTVLAVQGPPGAGKTYAGSRLVRALLDAGLRVGVTAQSHAVIANLLREIGRPALHKLGRSRTEPGNSAGGSAAGVAPPGGTPDGPVVGVHDNAEVVDALAGGTTRLVGGTAWLWARPELAGAVDVLVIDEAGQFSLANAVAVAQAARSVVLLGDPQQLTQPTTAEHPYGAGVSALAHLIGEADVVPADRGLFLDETYRMHPEVTAFCSTISYAGRLRSAPGRERQRVDAPGVLTGHGLRWVPVAHTGNTQDSPEEAAVVARLVDDLLAGTWTDDHGEVRALTPADMLVVAPYNAHVARLVSALPAGIRVGTVDRFQGQQAAVVLYATGSSSALDAPRGITFLYDVHRLNVAISRARALAVWVGAEALLDAAAAGPEQLRAVNGLCTFARSARVVPVPGVS